MYNNLLFKENKQLVLKIPATILSNTQLSFNEKLILGLYYSFQSKKGYNILSNIKVGQISESLYFYRSHNQRLGIQKKNLNKEDKIPEESIIHQKINEYRNG